MGSTDSLALVKAMPPEVHALRTRVGGLTVGRAKVIRLEIDGRIRHREDSKCWHACEGRRGEGARWASVSGRRAPVTADVGQRTL